MFRPVTVFTSVLALLVSSPVAARSMLLESATILERTEQVRDSYDYVIVGAGTAGLTVADRLISDEVIEAGGGRWFNDPGIQYNITSTPQPGMNNRTQFVWIGCCVGGSSAINGMVMVRGTKVEYDGWAELGGRTRPGTGTAVHFTPPEEEIAQAFNITWDPNAWGMEENTRVFASFPEYQNPWLIPTYQAVKKMPRMHVPLDGAGGDNGLFWFPSSIDPKSYRRSYARTGHYDGINRSNFEVITRHKVRKILFDGTTATGVEFTPRDGDAQPITVKATKEVILAAGAVHTPQVLQLSGIGPKPLLDEAGIPVLLDIPGVGQNFQDHAYLSVGYEWRNGTPSGPDVPANGDPSSVAAPNLGAWIGLPTMTSDFEAIASRYEAQDPADFLPEGTHPTVVAGYAAFKALHAKLLRDKNTNVMWLPLSGGAGGIVMAMHVVSHGTINIDPSDPEGEPVVDYRALSNPVDMDIMVEIVEFMRKYMASPDFAEFQPLETSPGANVTGEALREWIRSQYIPTNFHPIATAAKKPLEMGGVVNEDLLVHGAQRLRVVDGSIMPLLPGANTQQTVYMLAEKVSFHDCVIRSRDTGLTETLLVGG
ncbi:glucose oxidase [Colletotrichum tofieldiae]|nr:glucose oxidase [Colletotrichum tofieldiae]